MALLDIFDCIDRVVCAFERFYIYREAHTGQSSRIAKHRADLLQLLGESTDVQQDYAVDTLKSI